MLVTHLMLLGMHRHILILKYLLCLLLLNWLHWVLVAWKKNICLWVIVITWSSSNLAEISLITLQHMMKCYTVVSFNFKGIKFRGFTVLDNFVVFQFRVFVFLLWKDFFDNCFVGISFRGSTQPTKSMKINDPRILMKPQ